MSSSGKSEGGNSSPPPSRPTPSTSGATRTLYGYRTNSFSGIPALASSKNPFSFGARPQGQRSASGSAETGHFSHFPSSSPSSSTAVSPPRRAGTEGPPTPTRGATASTPIHGGPSTAGPTRSASMTSAHSSNPSVFGGLSNLGGEWGASTLWGRAPPSSTAGGSVPGSDSGPTVRTPAGASQLPTSNGSAPPAETSSGAAYRSPLLGAEASSGSWTPGRGPHTSTSWPSDLASPTGDFALDPQVSPTRSKTASIDHGSSNFQARQRQAAAAAAQAAALAVHAPHDDQQKRMHSVVQVAIDDGDQTPPSLRHPPAQVPQAFDVPPRPTSTPPAGLNAASAVPFIPQSHQSVPQQAPPIRSISMDQPPSQPRRPEASESGLRMHPMGPEADLMLGFRAMTTADDYPAYPAPPAASHQPSQQQTPMTQLSPSQQPEHQHQHQHQQHMHRPRHVSGPSPVYGYPMEAYAPTAPQYYLPGTPSPETYAGEYGVDIPGYESYRPTSDPYASAGPIRPMFPPPALASAGPSGPMGRPPPPPPPPPMHPAAGLPRSQSAVQVYDYSPYMAARPPYPPYGPPPPMMVPAPPPHMVYPPPSPLAPSNPAVAVAAAAAAAAAANLDEKKRNLRTHQMLLQQQQHQLTHQQQMLAASIRRQHSVPEMGPSQAAAATGAVGFHPGPPQLAHPQAHHHPSHPHGPPIHPAHPHAHPGAPHRGGPQPRPHIVGAPGRRPYSMGDNPLRSSLLEEFRSRRTRRYELSDLFGHVVEFSTDQHGSRFIQEKLDPATTEEKEKVFEEISPNALRLMEDVFGNYVIQKLYEHGTEEHKAILSDQMEGHVLRLSLSTYGCRVVQKALEHVSPERQVSLAMELAEHVLECVKDQNANHVIQKIIELVPSDRIQFIPHAFNGQVYQLAAHCYSCRVLQRIFEHCSDAQSRPLLDELQRSTQTLIEDQYGNYVVQWVLAKGSREDKVMVISKVRGQVLQLSKHKFASNVVEEVIRAASSNDRQALLDEILAVRPDGSSPCVVMMKDQYANYVLQRFLEVAEGEQRAVLVSRIRPQLASMKKYSSGYAKHLTAIEKLLDDGPGELPCPGRASSTAIEATPAVSSSASTPADLGASARSALGESR